MAMSRSLAGTELTSRPSIDSVPEEIDSSPAIMRNVVVLPQPDGPSSTMNSPCRISRLTESAAGACPRAYTLVSWSSVTTAMNALSFDCPGGHALDQFFREERIDDDHRDDGDHQSGGDHAGVLELIAHEALDAERQGAIGIVRDQHHGVEELVPQQDEIE